MPADEQFVDLSFPLSGIDLSLGYSEQRKGTTPEGINVRGFEPTTGRARGGQRPGLSRYIDAKVAGSTGEVQCLDLVILPDGSPLGISFDDVPVLDTVFQLIDPSGSRALLADGSTNWVFVGGSGYYTHHSYSRQSFPEITSISPSDGDFAGGDVVTVLGENMGDEDATFSFGSDEATVVSNDGNTAVILSPTVADGGSDLVRHVTVTTDVGTSAETGADQYTYFRIRHVQSRLDFFGDSASQQSLAFASNVTEGNLLLAAISTYGIGTNRTVTVTDDQGNTWTQVGTYQRDLGSTISLWYTIASATGSNTVKFTPNFTVVSSLGILEYSGVDEGSPNTYVAQNTPTASGAAWTTGNLTVAVEKSLVIGVFSQDFWDLSDINFTEDAGLTLRISQVDTTNAIVLFVAEGLNIDSDQAVSGTVDVPDLTYMAIGAVFQHR